jgi:pimeloyl-ACP methyl ester carboxylesterase
MMDHGFNGRRGLLAGGGLLGLGLAAAPARGQTAATQSATTPAGTVAPPGGLSPASRGDAAMRHPLPAPLPAPVSIARLPDIGLAFWDTGGTGEPVILLHAGTGSHAVWGYQQPVLAKAGYRVISYSRRGYLDSESGPTGDTGSASDDLERLADHLKIDRFHAVGTAAGAIVGVDFALSRAIRLRSLVCACTHMGITDPDYLKMSNGLRPKGFNEMPSEFREVGPSYRAANPEGTALWVELEHKSLTGTRIMQKPTNAITFAALRQLRLPVLIMGGDADLWAPPSVKRQFAAAIPGSELVIVPEAGHSAYWEQPEIFNETVLGFLGRHRG